MVGSFRSSVVRVRVQGSSDEAISPELLGSAQRGDREALETVLAGLAPLVYRVAAGRMGDGADAEDAAQEALVRIAKGLAGFRGNSRLSTWAYRIALRAAHDRGRSRARILRLETGPPTLEPESSQAGPADAAGGLEQGERVRKAVAELPEEQREAVTLRVWEGMGFEEIAEHAGCSVSTAHARLTTALERLRKVLGQELGDVT